MKGKSWGSLTAKPKEGYRQVTNESHSGPPTGQFLPGKPVGEFRTNVAGSHGGTPSGKFLGPTKGNSDLPINRTEGVSMGHGGGPHKAGGKGS
jgi:hypothetical protein